jgi:colanic acid/amylovoran biosynthesis glycosyltransferase
MTVTMRILIIVSTFPVPSETFILRHITGLIDRGHHVDILARWRSTFEVVHPEVTSYALLERVIYFDEIQQQVETSKLKRMVHGAAIARQRCGSHFKRLMKAFRFDRLGKHCLSLRPLFLQHYFRHHADYDIIHCHFGPNGLLGHYLRQVGAIDGALVTSFHGYDVMQYVRQNHPDVYAPLFSNGDLFLPACDAFKKTLSHLGCDEGKMVTHRMGVDCSRLRFAPSRTPNASLRLLSVGRLVEKKGFNYAIQAAAELAKKGQELRYDIVGEGNDRTELQALIDRIGVSDRIVLHGWKTEGEVFDLMSRADILLVPSITGRLGDQEATPLVIQECLAIGTPVIATNHGGISELISDGETGFLIPEKDVSALMEKITHVLTHPSDLDDVRARGRAAIEKHYDIDRQNDRILDIYRSLVNGNAPP